MKIIPFEWKDGETAIDYLHQHLSGADTKVDLGVVTFPADQRYPAEGFSAHEGTEISIILDGSFDLLGPDSSVEIAKGCMLILPPGREHAVQTKAPVKLMFALIEEQTTGA